MAEEGYSGLEYSSRVCSLCDYELNDNDEELIRLKAFEKKNNDRLSTEEKIERKFIAKVLTKEEQDKFSFITSDHKNDLL